MPYVFKSGQPIKVDAKTGKLTGGTYYPPGSEPEPQAVEGDPEQAKAFMRALGMNNLADNYEKWGKQAEAGEVPDLFGGNSNLGSVVTQLKEGQPLDALNSATLGDLKGTYPQATNYGSRGATDFIPRQVFNAVNGTGTTDGVSIPFPNVLERFASYNNIFSLGCLSPQELNYPDESYRKTGLKAGHILLRSNGLKDGEKPRTFAEAHYNIDTQYFIDDVEIETVIAPNKKSRATNFHTMRFKVREPYSMGMLLQSMQLCATNAGYDNYLQAPWLLGIEFIGYSNDNEVITRLPDKKSLPLKIVNVTFNVDTEGSNYDFVCSAFNDEAFTDGNQGIPVDITVSGKDLEQICQSGFNSLASRINTHYLNAVPKEKKAYEIDEYMIVFPSDTASSTLGSIMKTSPGGSATTGSATKPNSSREEVTAALATLYGNRNEYGAHSGVEYETRGDSNKKYEDLEKELVDGRLGYSLKRSNLSQSLKKILTGSSGGVNSIGRKKILPADPLGGGESPFGFANFALNPDTMNLSRGGTTISPTDRTITFARGTKIQRIIEELVLLSDFGKILLVDAKMKKDGMINWFRIETSVYIVEDKKSEKVLGRHPRIYVYKVVPYQVHSSVFQMPNSPPAGYDKLVENAVKAYNYMYTGLNKDILEFDIKFDNAFYASISKDSGKLNGSNDERSGGLKPDHPQFEMAAGAGNSVLADGKTVKKVIISGYPIAAGAVIESPEIKLARSFNEAVMNSESDLITMTLKILGDPYYIADSGIGNYNAESTNLYNINVDGTMNHQSGEVDVLINFQTPIDINDDTGGYKMDGSAIGVQNFSGLYKVVTVRNMFNGNLFTQELQLTKRPNFKIKDLAPTNQEKIVTPEATHKAKVEELTALYGSDSDLVKATQADLDLNGSLSIDEMRKAGFIFEDGTVDTTTAARLAKSLNTTPPTLAEKAKAAEAAKQQAATVNETFGTGTSAKPKPGDGGNNLI